jgi:hypothetical protein
VRVPAAAVARGGLTSQLAQWPVQLHLISPMNPDFQGADLLLAADCVAFAMPDFNQKLAAGQEARHRLPQAGSRHGDLPGQAHALVDEAQVSTISVMIMEVPCCGGLLRLAQEAVARATRKVPVKAIIVALDGEIRREAWV